MKKFLKAVRWWAVIELIWPLGVIVALVDPRTDPAIAGKRWDGMGVAGIVLLQIAWVVALVVAIIVALTTRYWLVAILSAAAAHLMLGGVFVWVTYRPAFVRMMGYSRPEQVPV